MYRAILFIQRKGAFGAWRGILFYIKSYVLQLNYFFGNYNLHFIISDTAVCRLQSNQTRVQAANRCHRNLNCIPP